MDSIPDPSSVTGQPQPYFAQPLPYSAIPAANGAHPPYSDMIVEAIVALKDKDGSSRQAIAKYIERHYPNLPPTHSNLLTHHLKRMKNQGQLTMVKHSYMLPPPRSVPFEAPTPTPAPTMDHNIADYTVTSTDSFGTSTGYKAENSSVQPRRKPGRPPKPRHEFGFQVQNQLPAEQPVPEIQPYQPQFEQHLGAGQDFHPQNQNQNPLGASGHDLQYGSGQEFQGNYAAGGPEPIFASLGLADDGVAPPLQSPENAVVSAKRGRGRPPKNSSASRPVVTSSGDGGGDGAGGGDAGAGGGDAGTGVGGDGGGGEVEGERRVKRKVGRPKLMSIMLFNGGAKKRGVGRPKRIGRPVTVPLSGNVMRSRGRPRKALRPAQDVSLTVNGDGGDASGEGGGSVSRGRGRPRKGSGGANTVQKSTSQSYGWPSEFGAGTSVIVTDPHQLVAYQDLKSKYEHLQSKAREVLNVARPYINSDYEAVAVLQELETLLGTDTSGAA